MGEAKRRKQLDPNYGQLQQPDSVLIKTWENLQPIIILRAEDQSGDLIVYGGQSFESFDVATHFIIQSETTIQKRYLQHGKGIVSLIPKEILMATKKADPKSFLEWNYWSYEEIKQVERKSLLFNNTKFIQPFLLWAMNHYQPHQEIILLLVGFPVNHKLVTGTPEELAYNRCYAILRHPYSTTIKEEITVNPSA